MRILVGNKLNNPGLSIRNLRNYKLFLDVTDITIKVQNISNRLSGLSGSPMLA